MEVVIVSTGIANIASVKAGFRRIGAEARVSESVEDIRSAERVMLPGVGAFGAGMKRLEALGLVDALRERIQSDHPTMAICLGLQLLASSSEETPGIEGLGILPNIEVREFSPAVRVPQLGWNLVHASSEGRFVVEDGHAYFANSYRIEHAPGDWSAALAEYDGDFVAAIERGSLLACQFHPELSGPWGLEVMRRWYEEA